MRADELLRDPAFDRALHEVSSLVEPVDGQPLSARLTASDGVLTVTVPFIYGVSLRVGGHFVGSTSGTATASLTTILQALERDADLPRLSAWAKARAGTLAAPLAGWKPIACIDRQRFDAYLRCADRRLMDALDRRARSRAAAGMDAADPHDDGIEDVAAAALAVPVDAWDMGDGSLIRLPGSFVFAAAMIGGLGASLSLFEQGPWLCLSTGTVEFIAVTDAHTWRVPIT